MSKKKDEHIKNIVSQVRVDRAPNNFTDNVMKDVLIFTNQEALKSRELSSLLKRTSIQTPSENFTSDIVKLVSIEKEMDFKPLINKKAWFIVVTILIFMILFVYFNEMPQQSYAIFDKISPYLEETQHLFVNPFKGLRFSPLLIISVLCLSSMLIFETVLKRKFINDNK